jgi:hypothetical protein
MDHRIIAAVQGHGFDVYMRKPSDTWLLFTDGKNLGYLQEDRLEGIALSTVHIPNQTTGTGFRIDTDAGELTREKLLECFCTAPSWASGRARASVKKWPSVAAFIASNGFNREYRLIPGVGNPAKREA